MEEGFARAAPRRTRSSHPHTHSLFVFVCVCELWLFMKTLRDSCLAKTHHGVCRASQGISHSLANGFIYTFGIKTQISITGRNMGGPDGKRGRRLLAAIKRKNVRPQPQLGPRALAKTLFAPIFQDPYHVECEL